MNKNFSIILLLIFLFISISNSQDSIFQRLSIEEAIEIAINNSPDMISARLDVEKADARVWEAWGYTMPSVDISGQYVKYLKKPTTYFPDFIMYPLTSVIDTSFHKKPQGDFIPITMMPQYSANAALTVKQIIFNGAVFIGVGAASIYSKMAHYIFHSKKVETVTKVKKAYYSALLAREGLELIRSSLENAEENLKNVRLMRMQGIVSEYDELRATVNVDNIKPVLIQNETNYSLALDNLKNVIGLESDKKIILSSQLTYEAVDDSLLAQAVEMLLKDNPNINIIKKQIQWNNALVNAERSNYLPTISAFGSYAYAASKDKFNFSTNDFFKSSQVGITVSLNIFQGFQTRSRVEQAQVDLRKTEEQLNNLEKLLKTNLLSIIGSLKQAQKRLQAQERTVETAERGYRIASARFLANASTQLEVNDAQLALNQAKVNRMQAVYDYLIASADLDQILGRLPAFLQDKDK